MITQKNKQQQPEYYQDALMEEVTELSSTLIKKHLDYGSRNLERFGLYGIVVRLTDKVERLINLQQLKRDAEVAESINDTLQDIAGYAIQARLLLKDQLALPIKQKDPS